MSGANMNDVRFDGRAVLITGAGRGLGRATALLVAARGGRVVVADNGAAKDGSHTSDGPAADVVREITATGGEAIACTADLATTDGCAAAVAACIDAFSGINAIAHLASPCPPLKAPDALVAADLELVFRVCVQGGLWLARSAWPAMAAQARGRIVLATSAGAYGAANNADYSSVKAAVIGAARCLAVDGAAHGIRVNAIAPAAMTRMNEGFHPGAYAEWFARTMGAERVAPGAAYLLSDACAVSGETFVLGGGRVARIALAESEGLVGPGDSVEGVRDGIAALLADERWFRPRNLAERSARVSALLGFDG
ncbi:MAG: SDR family NAD(P)-dependent oxidoreductase [Sphingomonadales bacterium]|nr:SDR family NAD(P)-dependent oxidoreductase [Sphingomonadales bacterium]